MIDNDIEARIRQYYYGHKYSKIQLSKKFNIHESMIELIIEKL